jgi:N-methylhydantoinase B
MSTVPMSGLDGATVEVVRSYLASAVEQARRTLVRTAFNPVIYEVLDFGISLYDDRLRLIAEAPGITHFLGANDYAIVKGVEYVGAETLRPGDVVMLNYPYWNSAHTYDALLFAPVFVNAGDGPAGYLCVRAHWMDLGGKDPAYVLDSTDMHQEGLVFPGTRIVKQGVIDDEILELIRFNTPSYRPFASASSGFSRCMRSSAPARWPARSTRCSTTGRGRCGARSPICPTASGRPRTGSTTTASVRSR